MEGVLPEQIVGAGYGTFSQAKKDAAVVKWMHETASVLVDEGTSAAEWARVDQLLRKFGTASRGRETINSPATNSAMGS